VRLQTVLNVCNSHVSISQVGILSYDRGNFVRGIFSGGILSRGFCPPALYHVSDLYNYNLLLLSFHRRHQRWIVVCCWRLCCLPPFLLISAILASIVTTCMDGALSASSRLVGGYDVTISSTKPLYPADPTACAHVRNVNVIL